MTKPAVASKDSGVEAAAWSSLCCLGGRSPCRCPAEKCASLPKQQGSTQWPQTEVLLLNARHFNNRVRYTSHLQNTTECSRSC